LVQLRSSYAAFAAAALPAMVSGDDEPARAVAPVIRHINRCVALAIYRVFIARAASRALDVQILRMTIKNGHPLPELSNWFRDDVATRKLRSEAPCFWSPAACAKARRSLPKLLSKGTRKVAMAGESRLERNID
jgi:hypothetical protein